MDPFVDTYSPISVPGADTPANNGGDAPYSSSLLMANPVDPVYLPDAQPWPNNDLSVSMGGNYPSFGADEGSGLGNLGNLGTSAGMPPNVGASPPFGGEPASRGEATFNPGAWSGLVSTAGDAWAKVKAAGNPGSWFRAGAVSGGAQAVPGPVNPLLPTSGLGTGHPMTAAQKQSLQNLVLLAIAVLFGFALLKKV